MAEEKRANPALAKVESMFKNAYRHMEEIRKGGLDDPDALDEYRKALDDTAAFAFMVMADGGKFYRDEDNGKKTVVFLAEDGGSFPIKESSVVKQAGGEEAYADLLKNSGEVEKPEPAFDEPAFEEVREQPKEEIHVAHETGPAQQPRQAQQGNAFAGMNLPSFNMQSMGFAEMAYFMLKSMEQNNKPHEVNADSEELTKVTAEADRLRGTVGALTAEKAELEKKLSEKTDLIADCKEKLLDKDLDLKKVQSEKETAEKIKAGLENDLNTVKTKLKTKEQELATATEQLRSLEGKGKTDRAEADRVKAQLQSITKEKSNLELEKATLNNKIRDMNQTIDEGRNTISKLQNEKAGLETAYKDAREKSDKAVADLKKQIEELKKQLEDASARKADPKAMEAMKAEREKLEKAWDDMREQLANLQKQNDELRRAARRDPVTGALNENVLQKNIGRQKTLGFMKIENTDFYAGYGAETVNKVYKKVADDLRATFPKADIYRIHGCYFVIGTQETVAEVEKKLKELQEKYIPGKIETTVAAAAPEKNYDQTIAQMVLSVEKDVPASTAPEKAGRKPEREEPEDDEEDILDIDDGTDEPSDGQPEYDENDADAPEEADYGDDEPDEAVEMDGDSGGDEGFDQSEDEDLEALIMDDEPDRS